MAGREVRQHIGRVGMFAALVALPAACGSDDGQSASTVAGSAVSSATTGSPVTAAAPTVPVTSLSSSPATAPATLTATVAPTTMPTPASTVAAAAGWAVHDEITSEQSGAVTAYDGVSCDSELGPWHIVASFEAPGNVTQDVFFDVTLDAGGTGALTGEEHTTWDDGMVIDGTYSGTATLTDGTDAGTFTLTLEYDEAISITDLSGATTTQSGQRTKTLVVEPAPAGECS